MSTYIVNNYNRNSFLFANYFNQVNKQDIIQFELQSIYDTMLVDCPSIVILEENHFNSIDLKNFFQDLDDGVVDIKNTKVIILCSDNYNGKKYINKNIKYISSSSYLLYNEFYKPSNTQNIEYMVCSLDCKNLEQNNMLAPLLYPNNKTIPVKLINCESVEHVQNIGKANEDETLKLINECCCYINIDNTYVFDAMLMNKPIINLVPNKYIEISQSLDPSCQIEKSYSSDIINKIKQYKISNILSQIIKLK